MFWNDLICLRVQYFIWWMTKNTYENKKTKTFKQNKILIDNRNTFQWALLHLNLGDNLTLMAQLPQSWNTFGPSIRLEQFTLAQSYTKTQSKVFNWQAQGLCCVHSFLLKSIALSLNLHGYGADTIITLYHPQKLSRYSQLCDIQLKTNSISCKTCGLN